MCCCELSSAAALFYKFINCSKEGSKITGVGIVHRGDTEYLKSIPNGNENDNLSNLPSVSPESQE